MITIFEALQINTTLTCLHLDNTIGSNSSDECGYYDESSSSNIPTVGQLATMVPR
jgi:hypothetical protein